MTFKYPLASTSWDQAEYDAMQRVIASGLFTMGTNVSEFEKMFADYIGSRYCVMVNSGSSANLLMVAALTYTKNPNLKLRHGDEVIVPAVSWSTTYYPFSQYGLKLKFVDIDLETLNYDLDQLEGAITDKTRAIVAVNLLGNPNDFIRINEIIGDRGIVLVEDNCESMGAELAEKKAGTFGVMGTFSSFFSHHISTMEGGMIVTDNEELFHILLSLRAHGWTRDLPRYNYVCGRKSDDPFKESFRFVLPGYNVRPLELQGALGIEQVKKLPYLIEERRKNGVLFQQAMADHPEILIQKEIGKSSWFGFSLVIRPGAELTRDRLLRKLTSAGFECRPIVAGNFARSEVVKYFDFEVHGDLKNADYIDSHGLFVGNHHYPMPEAIMELASIRGQE
ncbi:MAG: DegT/DnrJ/EryC1/StrS family aminotransferase [Methanobacteriota archaeon]|nr:MAG: DegT/DnrJ/EryC1/StrS family aminotransferase [Euryarchaeota archaeon]